MERRVATPTFHKYPRTGDLSFFDPPPIPSLINANIVYRDAETDIVEVGPLLLDAETAETVQQARPEQNCQSIRHYYSDGSLVRAPDL